MKELIIGGSGFLGSKLANSDCMKEASYTFFNNKTPFMSKDEDRCSRMDLRNKNEVLRTLKAIKPSLIIHCGGITDTDFCEKEKQYSWDVNVEGVENLMRYYDGKIIYFSTDYVFDGNNPSYDEESKPNPVNYYGITKLQAEKMVLKREENLVIRVSGLFGINTHNDKFLNKIRKEKIEACTNLVSSPTYIDDIVKNIPELVQLSSIVHLSCQEGFSRYDFLNTCVKYLSLSTTVVPKKYDQEQSIAKRPYNTTMVSLRNVKYTPVKIAFKEMGESL